MTELSGNTLIDSSISIEFSRVYGPEEGYCRFGIQAYERLPQRVIQRMVSNQDVRSLLEDCLATSWYLRLDRSCCAFFAYGRVEDAIACLEILEEEYPALRSVFAGLKEGLSSCEHNLGVAKVW